MQRSVLRLTTDFANDRTNDVTPTELPPLRQPQQQSSWPFGIRPQRDLDRRAAGRKPCASTTALHEGLTPNRSPLSRLAACSTNSRCVLVRLNAGSNVSSLESNAIVSRIPSSSVLASEDSASNASTCSPLSGIKFPQGVSCETRIVGLKVECGH